MKSILICFILLQALNGVETETEQEIIKTLVYFLKLMLAAELMTTVMILF